ncbi:MAG: PTS IIA-like nitrogen regulatory protein PtsN [Hyphomicrobiales bacterium]|nr:PTS IIA-like nitrogen regulatory protein PtsN [Hyphomicrobiales bacterium]
MDLGDLISTDSVIARLPAKSKKQVLQALSAHAAEHTDLPERDIFDTLLQREKLGSTGVGRGVAIPHGKLAGLPQILGIFARLEQPVEFESVDREPVDLVFLLLAPESAGADHLKALARISRLLREPASIEKLRAAKDETALYTLLSQVTTSHAA